MSEIRIEKFMPSKRDEYAAVMRAAFNFVDQDWSEAESVKYITLVSKHDCVLGAVINGKLVGFLSAETKEDHLYIDAIGTLPEYMRQGIARALWDSALAYARKNSITQVKMIADPKSIAFQWYKKLGFVETGWVEIAKNI